MIINVACTGACLTMKKIVWNVPLCGASMLKEMINMGLTQDQKIDLAIALVNRCDDEDLVEEVFHAAYHRLLVLHFGEELIDEEVEK